MSVVWHIVRKDLFRLKWILLLWAVLLAGSLALVTIQSGLDGETYYPFWVVTNIVVVGFLPLFAFGLVMGLMHDDPVAEIDAFWITRPISGGELLAAKTLGLVLISLVPILVMLPFWLAHDYTSDQVMQSARQMLEDHFLVVAAAVPVALVSANGSKFVMNVMLGAGGVLLLLLCLRLVKPQAAGGDPWLVHSKSCLILWLWLTTCVLVALNQFLRRRLRWSVVALIAATVAGIAVTEWWSRPLKILQPVAAGSTGSGGGLLPGAFLVQVPVRERASSSHRGATLKVQSVFVDFTGELQVTFSEAFPQPALSLADRLPGAPSRQPAPADYFLTDPDRAHVLPVKPQRIGDRLVVADMWFTHAGFRIRPGNTWQGKAPADFKAWLQGASLVKRVAAGSMRPAGEGAAP